MLLDQDSVFAQTTIDILLSDIQQYGDDKTAIIAGNHDPNKHLLSLGLHSPDNNIIISSGSIVNMNIIAKEGGMMDELFIDCVDYEFCYRMIEKGYRILRDNRAIFEHYIGNRTVIDGVKVFNYPPIRYYYIARNNSIVGHLFKHRLRKY